MQGNVILWALGKKTENETFIFKDTIMKKILKKKILMKKILGVTIDNKLTFNSHIRELCKNASQKYRICQEYQTNLMILKETFFLTL